MPASRLRALASLVLASVCVAGCSSRTEARDLGVRGDAASDAATDDAGSADAAPDAALTDLGATDAGESDAAEPDAGASDAGLMCGGAETRMPSGICDGRGMVACTMWAQDNAGTGTGYAVCLQAGTGGCTRADACVDASDPSTCTCGLGAACGPQEACARDTPADPQPRCRCIALAAP